MERFINFRAFLFIFIGAIIGVVFSLQSFFNNLELFIVLSILILSLLLFVILTYFLDKKKRFTFINKFLICFLIGFIFFSGTSFFNFNIFHNLKDVENAFVEARVSSINNESNYQYMILEDCIVTDLDTEKGFKTNSKISLVLHSDDIIENLSVGDNVKFKGILKANSLINNDRYNSYSYKFNIKYSAFIDFEDFSFTNGNLKFDEKVRESVKNILYNNMSYDNASICYATIFGDKTLLDSTIYESFSLSGTAHILCVSGLHIGFIVTLLYFIFKLFKLKRKYILIMLIILLTFYCYLCSFSPSVIRASIMSIILCFSTTFGTRYDNLSSLSLAGVLILLVRPLYVFDLGFQLSFAACFGIILLMPSLTRFFQKINFDNKFSGAFALTLSAQLGTFPIILHNFEKMSFLSICANVIIVPLFSVIFSLLLIFVLFNTILPFGFLFYLIELGINFIVFISKSFGAISSMIFSTSSFTLIYSIIFYLLLLCISRFINLKSKQRLIGVLMLVVIFCFSYLMQFYPINYNKNLILNGSIDNSTIITNSSNKKIMINVGNGTSEDLDLIKKDLFNYKILKLDALILTNYDEDMQATVCEICNSYNVNILYIPNMLSENEGKYLFKNLNSTFIFKVNNEIYNFENFSFRILSEINGLMLNIIENNHSLTLLLANNLDKVTSGYILKKNLKADFVKFNYINKKYIESIENFDIILCNYSNIKQANIFSLKNINRNIDLNLLRGTIYEI